MGFVITTAEAVTVNDTESVVQLESESHTRAVNVVVPLPEGVPESTPEPANVKPVGGEPEETFQA